jgi:hypothetical protein
MHEKLRIRDPLDCHMTNRLDCHMFPHISDWEPNSTSSAAIGRRFEASGGVDLDGTKPGAVNINFKPPRTSKRDNGDVPPGRSSCCKQSAVWLPLHNHREIEYVHGLFEIRIRNVTTSLRAQRSNPSFLSKWIASLRSQ